MLCVQKTIWRLLLRVSLTKDGLVLGLQKNFQARSGITYEASIGFLRSIITRALPIARKAAEDPWLLWQTKIWLMLNSSFSHKTINQELTKASVKLHVSLACHGDRYSECWRSTVSIRSRSRECEHRWSDSEKSYFAVEKVFSSSGKAERRTYSVHFFAIVNIDWWLLWHFGVACVRATTWMMNRVQTSFYDMQHYFVYITANTKVF